MTQGSALKAILFFAIPLLIGSAFQQVYSLVDTMVAGYCLGDEAIAAIGATSSLNYLILAFAMGLNAGFAILISQAFGAGDTERIRRLAAGAALLCAAACLLLTSVFLPLLPSLLRLLNTPEDIFDPAWRYLSVIWAGLPATVCYNLFACVMRSFGNSRTPLFFLVFSSILNVALDLLLVAGFHTGVAGAAWATVIAQTVCAAASGRYLFRHYRRWLPGRRHISESRRVLAPLLASGLAMAALHCVYAVGSVIFQGAANALGQEAIAAHTSARRVLALLKQPQDSLAEANSIFAAQNKGAGRIGRIRNALRQVLRFEILWGVWIALIAWLLGEPVIRLVTATDSGPMLSRAVLSLRCHCTALLFLGPVITLRSLMQSLGQKLAPVSTSALELVMKVISAVWAIPALGFLGVCLTEPSCWVLMAVFLWIIYRRTTVPHYLRE